MTLAAELQTIRENLEAAEVDCYVSQLTDALYAFVPLLDAVEKVLALGDVVQDNPYDEYATGYNEALADMRTAITTALEALTA